MGRRPRRTPVRRGRKRRKRKASPVRSLVEWAPGDRWRPARRAAHPDVPLAAVLHPVASRWCRRCEEGDRVLVNKLSYKLHDVHRGDVVVFERPPSEPDTGIKDFIKRVIGLPGETIEVQDCQVAVNGKALDEPYVQDPQGQTRTRAAQPAAPVHRPGRRGVRDGRQPRRQHRQPLLRADPREHDRRPRLRPDLAVQPPRASCSGRRAHAERITISRFGAEGVVHAVDPVAEHAVDAHAQHGRAARARAAGPRPARSARSGGTAW